MATETRTRYRSAGSGKYVQKDTARRNPRTTVTERDRVRTTSKKKKPTVRPSSTARVTARRGNSTRTTRR